MRAILFLIGGVVLANIVWATFFWHAPANGGARQFTTENSATTRRARTPGWPTRNTTRPVAT